jgi:hypothetical protein
MVAIHVMCIDMTIKNHIEKNVRILVDPTSDIRSSQRLSHACLSTN